MPSAADARVAIAYGAAVAPVAARGRAAPVTGCAGIARTPSASRSVALAGIGGCCPYVGRMLFGKETNCFLGQTEFPRTWRGSGR